MDCLSEDKGLVAVREGYDRYRGVPWMPRPLGCERVVKQWMIHGYSNDTVIFNDMLRYFMAVVFLVRYFEMNPNQLNQ